MARRAALGKGSPIDDHIVLHILDDQRSSPRINHQWRFAACRLVCRSRSGWQGCGNRRWFRNHERLRAPTHFHVHRVERCAGAHEERLPVIAAPVEVGDHLRALDFAEFHAVKVIDPDTSRRGHIDVSMDVGLHPVGHTGAQFLLDSTGKNASVDQPTVGINIEHPDVGLIGIVDPHELFARREAEPVRLAEHVAIGNQLRLVPRAMTRRKSVNPLKSQL